MRGGLKSVFDHLVSPGNLLVAWQEFRRSKTSRKDVQEFYFNLEDNIFELHDRLKAGVWHPDPYISFYIRDPKLRHIHKASVRDRVFNQALFMLLEPIFDKHFIYDSFSCRYGKGTHKGVLRLESFLRKNTNNHTSQTFILKCDIRKFFDNISHDKLLSILRTKIKNGNILAIIEKIIFSFEKESGRGLPLGNVTSQLFANVYLNELDQFIKHQLKIKYYIRYCDDFVILDKDKYHLLELILKIENFLSSNLDLHLHPHKIKIRKSNWGIDFLGYVILPHYIVLRTKTKRRILQKIKNLKGRLSRSKISKDHFDRATSSYKGMLTHCKGHKILQMIDES